MQYYPVSAPDPFLWITRGGHCDDSRPGGRRVLSAVSFVPGQSSFPYCPALFSAGPGHYQKHFKDRLDRDHAVPDQFRQWLDRISQGLSPGLGITAIAGYQVSIRVLIFFLLPAWGMSNAAATLVGQNLGAKLPDRSAQSVRTVGLENNAVVYGSGDAYFPGRRRSDRLLPQ